MRKSSNVLRKSSSALGSIKGEGELPKLLEQALSFIEADPSNINATDELGNTILHQFAMKGDLSATEIGKLNAILNYPGIDFSIENELGATAFALGCSFGHIEFVKVFLERADELRIPLTAKSRRLDTTPLAIAVNSNRTDILELLLSDGRFLSTINEGSRSSLPLALAAQHKDCACANMLLQLKEIDINAASGAALATAVSEDNLSLTKELLTRNPLRFTEYGQTEKKQRANVASLAAESGSTRCLMELHQAGFDLVDGADYLPPIYAAASKNHGDTVRYLLKTVPDCLSATCLGFPLLFQLLSIDIHADLLRQILSHPEAPINVKQGKSSLLSFAISCDKADAVHALLARDDLQLRDPSIVQAAVQAGNLEYLRLLLEKLDDILDIPVDWMDYSIDSAAYAIVCDGAEALNLLVHSARQKFDRHKRFPSLGGYLHVAAKWNSSKCWDLLLKLKVYTVADAYQASESVPSPFITACSSGSQSILHSMRQTKALTSRRINTVCPVSGETPLTATIKAAEFFSMIEVLSVSGVDPNLRNRQGESPIHLAASLGLYSFTQVLLQLRNTGTHTENIKAATTNGFHAVASLLRSSRSQSNSIWKYIGAGMLVFSVAGYAVYRKHAAN